MLVPVHERDPKAREAKPEQVQQQSTSSASNSNDPTTLTAFSRLYDAGLRELKLMEKWAKTDQSPVWQIFRTIEPLAALSPAIESTLNSYAETVMRRVINALRPFARLSHRQRNLGPDAPCSVSSGKITHSFSSFHLWYVCNLFCFVLHV